MIRKIGEKYNTDDFGPAYIKDIYISITHQQRIFEVIPIETLESEPDLTKQSYFLIDGSFL